MIEIRYVQSEDREFWYSLDKHLPEQEFDNKVINKRAYVLLDDIIFFGITHHFVQCCLLIGIIMEKAMEVSLWSIGKMI